MIPLASDALVTAAIPIDWDDPMSVGCQTSKPHGGTWCPSCCTGNHWSWVPFLGLLIALDVCWWCNGPMGTEKPTRTHQATDTTVERTNWTPGSDRIGWRPTDDDDPWGYYANMSAA